MAFALSLLAAIVVSRMLSPHEIGIFSISASLIGFAHVLREFGVEQYIVQTKELTRSRRRAAFTATLLISLSIACVLYAVKPIAAEFYEESGVDRVMSLLALNFLILPFVTPLRAQLQREMQFSKIAATDLLNHFCATAVTIFFVSTGSGYTSMAFGSVAGNVCALFVLIFLSPRGALDWPTLRGLREVFRFGSRSSVASFSLEIGDAAPDLVLGRTLGFSDAAYFSRANGVLSMTVELLRSVVQSVFFPVFSRSHRDGHDLKELYLQSSSKFLAAMLPALSLMALLSGPLIELMFGPQWSKSALLAVMLCAFAILTGPVMLAPYALVAIGQVGSLMRCRLILAVVKVLVLLSSTWLALEVTTALLLLVSLVELRVFTVALRVALGISLSTLWVRTRWSYTLIPVTLLPPTLVLWILQQWGIASPVLHVGLIALLGGACWTTSALLTQHPLRAELAAVARSAIAVFARRKA